MRSNYKSTRGFDTAKKLIKYFVKHNIKNYSCLACLPLKFMKQNLKIFAANSYLELLSITSNIYLYDTNRIALSQPKTITLQTLEKIIAQEINRDIIMEQYKKS